MEAITNDLPQGIRADREIFNTPGEAAPAVSPLEAAAQDLVSLVIEDPSTSALDLPTRIEKIRAALDLSTSQAARLEASLEALYTRLPARQTECIGHSRGSGLLSPSELAKFEYPMTSLLRDATQDDHKRFNVHWEGAWAAWSKAYYKHGKENGLKHWDISDLKTVTDNFSTCEAWFKQGARETDWDRYYDMDNFAGQSCYWISYQRTLWKLAKNRRLKNATKMSEEAWEDVVKDFSLFLWMDFYVMNFDFRNSYYNETIVPDIYSYVVYF